jgi:hypothetical protein
VDAGERARRGDGAAGWWVAVCVPVGGVMLFVTTLVFAFSGQQAGMTAVV